jgi:hypothetical protein
MMPVVSVPAAGVKVSLPKVRRRRLRVRHADAERPAATTRAPDASRVKDLSFLHDVDYFLFPINEFGYWVVTVVAP